MNIFAFMPNSYELDELITQFKPTKVYIMQTTADYSSFVEKYSEVEFEFFNYFKFFSTAFSDEEISNLPAVDKELLDIHKDMEIECLFNEERIGRNNGFGWNGKEIVFDKELIFDSYNKYFYQVERKTTLERFRDFRYQLAYWNNFFDTNQIDLIFHRVATHMPFDRVITSIANYKRIKFYYLQNCSIIDRSFVIDNDLNGFYENLQNKYDKFLNTFDGDFTFKNDDSFNKEYDRITKSEGVDFIPKYEIINTKNRLAKKSLKYKFKNKVLKKRNLKNFISLVSIDKLMFSFLNKKKEKNRVRIIKKYFTNKIDLNTTNYFYYPLHFQPEETSCPRGGRYADQLLIVKLISECLPDDYKLIVKDHPQQTNLHRPIWFYKEISLQKNVILASTSVESKELIENSKAIVTISGTAAWEGFGKGKSAILFGTHPNQVYKYAYKVNNKKECLNAIDLILNIDKTNYIKELNIFFEFLFRESIQTNYYKVHPNSVVDEKESAKNYISKIKQMYFKT